MALRIIIPVKPFGEAKQRLAPALTAKERAQLARDLFGHVLATAVRFAGLRAAIVISRAPEILDLAKTSGALGLLETSSPHLNAALAQAAEFARANASSKLLIVASDLPFLCEADLAAMTEHDCAVAPDRHRRGTNALLWPTDPLPGFHFGESSFERHRATAIAAGFAPQIISRPGLAHDVDVPADLPTIVMARESGPRR